jgi:hypothetical protein
MAGFFDTLFGGGAEREAADKNKILAGQYGTDANAFLKTGYDTGVDATGKAIGAFSPLADLGKMYSGAGATLTGALGVGTPEEVAKARGQFQTSPGYGFQQDQMAQALARQRASGGMGASGNADVDAMNYAHGLSDMDFQKWLTNLSGVAGMGMNATSGAAAGQAGGYNNLASLAGKYAGDQTGVSGNVLGANTSANTLQAQGEASGAKNLLGAGLSLASLAMGPMGAAAGGAAGAAGGGGFGSTWLGAGINGLTGLGKQMFASNPYGGVTAPQGFIG